MGNKRIKIKTKICSQCNVEKNVTEFKLISSKDPNKFRAACKICIKLNNKIYSENNKEKIYENNKKYREENRYLVNENARFAYHENFAQRSIQASISYVKNKDKIIKRREVFAKENPEKIRERVKRASKKHRSKIENRLHESISSSVSKTIKNSGKNKNKLSISKYLQYTFFKFKEHLELQFESWMNWENYGRHLKNKQTWQIDHIIPRTNFTYDDMNSYNFQKCWALANLRPLSATENASKKDNISDELYDETMDKINLELEMRAESDSEFKMKFEKWKLEEELNIEQQLKKVG